MIDIFGFNLSIFSLLFLTIFGAFFWYTFSLVYHLIRFGIGREPKIMALIFVVGSFVLFNMSIGAYNNIDWQEIIKNIWPI